MYASYVVLPLEVDVDGDGAPPSAGAVVESSRGSGGKRTCSSDVVGLAGRERSRKDEESSESTAKDRKSADLALTHSVQRYSARRVR